MSEDIADALQAVDEKVRHLQARKKAMDLLARREHAVAELRRKLLGKGFEAATVERVLAELQADGLLSDARFTEAYVRYRRNSGHGPQRIQQELRERGVSDETQAAWLDFTDPQWLELVEQTRRKRFGPAIPTDYKERARQSRFLQYRGFTSEQIRRALGGADFE